MATFAPDIAQSSLLDDDRCAPTLDDLVAGAWTALAVADEAACPVCGGDVAPRYSAGSRPVAGSCRSCGTEMT